MDRLKTLTVSESMAAIFFAGLSVAVFFVTASIFSAAMDRMELTQDRLIVTKTQKIGAVIHEIQRERGLTTAWLSTPTGGLSALVEAQRLRTDDALTRAQLVLPHGQVSAQEPKLASDLALLSDWLIRARMGADTGALDARGFRDAMSGQTAQMIASVAESGTKARSGGVALLTHNVAGLMAAKDAIGLERTLGTIILAQRNAEMPGKIADRNEMIAQGLITQTWLRSFRLRADADARNFLDLWQNSSAVRKFQAARADVLGASVDDATPKLALRDWVAGADRVTDALREVERRETNRLIERLNGAFAEVHGSILRDIGMFFFLLLLFGGIAYITLRRVDDAIHDLIGTVCQLSVDADSAKVNPCPQRDLNQISKALLILKAAQIERTRSLIATEALRNRVDEELERVFANVDHGSVDSRMDILGLDAHGATLARGVNRLLDRIERDRVPKAS